jgi:hypothetical protein
MHDVTRQVPPDPCAPTARHHLVTTTLIVVVLGVLPFAWDAAAVWRVLGPIVSAAVLVRSLRLLWRDVFSTDPRHLGMPG